MTSSHRLPPILEPHRARLGVETDTVIARDVGLSSNAVQYHRVRLGIPASSKGRIPVVRTWPPKDGEVPDWLLPHVTNLGVLTDAEVARATGRSREIIRLYRTALGRPKAPPPDLSSITGRLGVVQDATLAAEIGVSVARVSRLRVSAGVDPAPARLPCPAKTALDPYLDQIGVLPDREIAALASVSLNTVCRTRLSLGRAPVRSTEPRRSRAQVEARLAPYLDKLGVWTDTEVAHQAGVGIHSARRARMRKEGTP
jgi:hypothetical protein